jgi:hypothetical protein
MICPKGSTRASSQSSSSSNASRSHDPRGSLGRSPREFVFIYVITLFSISLLNKQTMFLFSHLYLWFRNSYQRVDFYSSGKVKSPIVPFMSRRRSKILTKAACFLKRQVGWQIKSPLGSFIDF